MQLDEIIDHVKRHPRLVVADDYELSVQQIIGNSQKFRNGTQTHCASEAVLWVSLRLVHRKRPGKSTTFFRTKEALDGLVDDAFESALHSDVDPWFRLPLLKSPPIKEERIGGMEEKYSPLFPELARCPDTLEEVYEQRIVETQIYRRYEKADLKYRKPVHAFYFSVLGQNGQKNWRRDFREFSRPLQERKTCLETLLESSSEKDEGAPDFAESRADLLLGPAVMVALLRRMAPWFFADHVQQGRSPFSNLLEKKPFSQVISIVDDGTYRGGAGTAPFDVEGCLSKKTVVVENGELCSHLYDTYAATKENRLSTANLTRSKYALTARVGPTNLYLKPGSTSEPEFLALLKDGVWVHHVNFIEPEPGTEANFLFQGSGWRVQGGGKVHPVEKISFKFNMLDLLSRAVAAGRDLTFFGRFGAPSIFFEKIPLRE